ANVFKSTNGGASWSPSNAGLGNQFDSIFALAIDPQALATLYAGVSFGVFKSTNGGASWRPRNAGLGQQIVRAPAIPPGRCLHAGTSAGTFSFATRLDSECLPPPPLVAALLPSSRSVEVGTGATAFASIVNAGVFETGQGVRSSATGVEGVTCGITQLTGLPTPFTFQATDPVTNQPIGQLNTPVDIAAGGYQTFVISLTPTAAFEATNVQFGFHCTNTDLAPTVVGLNTLLLTASATPVPDIVALAATMNNDGIVD